MTHDYKRNGTTTLFAALMSLRASSSAAACSATAIKNSSAFSMPSSAGCRPARWSTWFSTTTPSTSLQGHGLAAAASALHLSFHLDFLLLGQRSRGLVRQAYPTTAQTRRFHLDRRSSGRNQPFHRGNQRQAQAIRLDQIRRCYPRRRQPRDTSVRSNPLASE